MSGRGQQGDGRRRTPRVPAPLLVVGLALLALLPACSADRPAGTLAAAPATGVGADASRSRAAELQAGLTHLLVERVDVTAAARAAVGGPAADAGATALDDVAVALADLLGATYTGAREPLLVALRAGDRRTLEHAAALRAPDGGPGGGARALVRLQAAQDDLAATLRRVVPRLGADQVRARLDGDLAAQLAVGGEDPYALLRTAAGRAPETARLLTGGIAQDRALGGSGGRAATLRAELTGLLTEHVLLSGAVARDVRHRPSAVRALRANGADVTALLATSYPDLAAPLGASWARHVDRVVALAVSPGPVPRRLVLAYAAELGALLAQHVVGLPARATAVETTPLLRALAAAVEAGGAPGPLAAAAAVVPVPSALLAAAIAQDRRYT